eukprot:gene1105-1658_t
MSRTAVQARQRPGEYHTGPAAPKKQEIEKMKAAGDQSPAERARLLREIEHLKQEFGRQKRKEEQEKEQERSELEEEVVEEGEPEEPDSPSRLSASEAAKPRQEHLDALSARIKQCGRKGGAATTSLTSFPLGFPSDLSKEDWFLHKSLVQSAVENSTSSLHNLSFIPKSAKHVMEQYTWGKCAVVGSSSSLLGSGYGTVIDSHDVVVRLNDAPTIGVEEHVGYKTTFRILNRRWSSVYNSKDPKVNGKKVPLESNATLMLARTPPDIYERVYKVMQASHPGIQVLAQNPRVFTYAQDLLKAYRQGLPPNAARASLRMC